ncbi:MAG: IS1 family transposase [Gemmatimonadaceae bacterium]
MNRLSTEKRAALLRSLVDGASVSAASRMIGVSKVTALKLLADIGEVCAEYQRATLNDLPCRTIECDEIWSWVGAKEKNVPRDEKGRGRGDVWTWTAICADTKLIPCWHLGTRDANAAALFMEDLASRLRHRVQLTTDGHRAYLRGVEGAFGWNGVDYAMLMKIYGPAPEGQTRYSPPQIIGAQAEWVMGNPDPKRISTSYAERQNQTMLMNMRRFTRLTNVFSKKMENHAHALALYFMHYNFCRPHQTLTKAKGGIKQTPAMAAGVADHAWTMEEVVGLLGQV